MSPKDVKITCDACGRDLTYTGNCVDYRLVLAAEGKGPDPDGGGAVTAMMIYPPVERTHYFCGLGCLDKWSEPRRQAARERASERP